MIATGFDQQDRVRRQTTARADQAPAAPRMPDRETSRERAGEGAEGTDIPPEVLEVPAFLRDQ